MLSSRLYEEMPTAFAPETIQNEGVLQWRKMVAF